MNISIERGVPSIVIVIILFVCLTVFEERISELESKIQEPLICRMVTDGYGEQFKICESKNENN